MERKVIFKNRSIHYSIHGEGIPVFFLHGFGEDASIWLDLMPYLNKKKTILVDLPGSGKSQILEDEYTGMSDYADCIQTIAQEEKIQKYVIIGHSMGGYIALASLKKHPEKLLAIGLFHSNIYSDQPAKMASRRKSIEFIKTNGAHAFLQISIPPLFHNASCRSTYIQKLNSSSTQWKKETLIQHYHSIMNRTNSIADLKNSGIPVLFIIGKHDSTVSFEESLNQLMCPNETHVAILRNSGHMGMLEETEKCACVLNNFLTHISSHIL